MIPILFTVALIFRRKMRVAFTESRKAIASINANLESSITGIRVTKAYTNSEKEQEKFDLTEKNKEKDSKIKALIEDCGKFDKVRAELKTQIQSLQENQFKSDNPNSVTLQFEDFDFAVLKYCLEKFNAETDKNFNESELIKYMFTEYAVKGSIYFFKTPGFFKLKEIQKQVEEQKQNHNNE